jgi:hypothetical protein
MMESRTGQRKETLMTHHVDHATITLAKGGHDGEDSCGGSPQRCLFEWYNWLTRDEHTDACPPGVSRVLHSFGIALNDLLPDDRRQELVRYLPNGTSPLAGTDDGRDEARGYLALDWLIRTYLPTWLALVPALAEHAAAAAGLPVIAGLETAEFAGPVVRAAGDAAGDAARATARDAAGDAARDAARDAAGDAAGDAARAAAWATARDAARDLLAPTVAELQTSAIALYDRMITP